MSSQEVRNTAENQNGFIEKPPEYKLYTPKGVMIATFFGTAIAGGYLIAKNYKRLGNDSGAWQAMFYSLLVVIGSFIVGSFLPDNFPSMAVSVPVLFGMGVVMKHRQGAALEQHLQNHGQYESCWKAWGISLLFMVAIALILVAILT